MRQLTVSALFLTGFLATGIGGAHAQAFSQTQLNAMEHISQVLAGTEVCTRLTGNDALIGLFSLRLRVLPNNPAVREHLQERTASHRNRIKGRTQDDICAALIRLFGPEGSNVRNLVVPKPS